MFSSKMNKLRDQYRTDVTIKKVKDLVSSAPRRLPSAAGQYLSQKAPIVQWLPKYSPKWILNDFIAGMTIGVMMIPQALAYAKIATIPGEFGLYSSWLPAVIYVFMGTSKDLSTGPTSIMGLLTAEIIVELEPEGFQPQDIASAVALMVGVYSLILGLLKLGFVLDYISVPVLSGFLSAAALTILLGQVGSLVGLSDVPSGTAPIIRNVLSRIREFRPLTLAIGFGGILLLYILEFIGRKWGKRHVAIKFLSSSRAVIVLFIFTTISFLVNRDLDKPLWDISKITSNGIVPPKLPTMSLVEKVATKAVAPLVASALEHLAIGRAFGRKNGYVIDTSQELNYLGVTNFFNSFFSAMSVGGAMSRTAVNSECGVRSPLNGIFTAGFILLTLYKLSGALFWIPKATLSAIIIMAVIHVIGPLSLFYRFWRVSFADFSASMLSFWITLFVSTEVGIAVAVVFSIAYTMVRLVFAAPKVVSSRQNNSWKISGDNLGVVDVFIPSDAILVRFSDAVFYPNANRIKTRVLEDVQVTYVPGSNFDKRQGQRDEDRSWSVAGAKRIDYLRKRDQVQPLDARLTVIVWDFSGVPFIDVTGVLALGELKEEVRKYLGRDVEIRFVGMNDRVARRFERAQWKLAAGGSEALVDSEVDVIYPTLETALWDRTEFVVEKELVLSAEYTRRN